MEDLEESILLEREALTIHLPGHPRHSRSLANLAAYLISRYHRLGKREDLEECIVLDREALSLRPPGHPERLTSLDNLALYLSTRYTLLGKMEDLEESILLEREALTICQPGHPNHPISMGNLAASLNTRYKKLVRTEDLEESVLLGRKALTLRPPGHPDRSSSLTNLAETLDIRYTNFGNSDDLQEIFTLYEQAVNDPTSYLKDRLWAAIQWAQIARRCKHQSVLKAYTVSLEFLHRALISRPNVEEQHSFLATSAGSRIPRTLASDAASAAIEAGNLELAVEFLEQGRAMLWSRVDKYKSPLEQLQQIEPDGGELAKKFGALSARLERLALLSDKTSAAAEGEHLFDAQIRKHRILSEQWDDLVEKIRKKEGFTHFLKSPQFDTLQSAAKDGPVILLNVSEYRSDAIILMNNKPPTLVPLPEIDLAELRDQVPQITSEDSHLGIRRVLRYLWDTIVSYVVIQLRQLGVEEKSRIWWCPTAELCALPLHAAGCYRKDQPRQNLPDLYISSYTSTLSSLIRARSDIQSVRIPRLLLVGQPHDVTLRNVKEEVEIIKQYGNTHPIRLKVLLDAEASQKAVLDALVRYPWAHFACHGHLGPGENAQPFKSSFELYKGHHLTLLQLIQARLPNAQFAFLAACNSAAGGSHTPDETIHLSAALQFCGFRSVVGTLWKMIDEDGPMMSREFYKCMFADQTNIDFRNSAFALSSAVREMRKARLGPEHWAMFVHIGA